MTSYFFAVVGASGHGPNPNVGYGDYDYVFDLNGDGDGDFYDGPLGARPAVPGFQPRGEPGHNFGTIDGREKFGFSPLPRCTYINTDIYGDDVGDGKGLSAGSASGCKEACAKTDVCQFWTYRLFQDLEAGPGPWPNQSFNQSKFSGKDGQEIAT
jgi:hypothetical protein